MKKALKVIGIILLSVALIVGGFALFIHLRGIPSYKPVAVDLKFDYTPERVQHGGKLVQTLCLDCHIGDDNKLSGGWVEDIPKSFGKAFSSNITNDKTYGIGNWTDGQLAAFFRTGIKPNGQYAPPWMPPFNRMADEDIKSIIAYLRSPDPLVAPSQYKSIRSEPSFLMKFLCTIQFKPFKYPTAEIVVPPKEDRIAYGRYLATGRYDCYNCHSADFKTNDAVQPEKSKGFFGGGNVFQTKEGGIIRSANITFDMETGIGKYTEDEFVKAVLFGTKRDGTPIRYPMPPYSRLEEEEARAIYAYLKTVPVISNKVN